MSYDATLPTIRDRIRFIVGDIDAAAEYFPDATYDSEIAQYSNWKIAAASMAESVANLIEKKPSSFTATGDLSISWQGRTTMLRLIASRLRAEAGSEDAIGGDAVVSVQLQRSGRTSGAAEYRPSAYRTLRR